MQREEVSPLDPSSPPTSPRPSSASILLLFCLLIGVAEVFLLPGMTFFSRLALLAVLLIGGTVFALTSLRGPGRKNEFTESGLSSVQTTAPQSHATGFPTLSLQSPIPSVAPRNHRTVDTPTVDSSGRQAIDFNVRTTVEETVSRFTPLAKDKGVELSCLFSSDSPTPFRGDPGDLRLILLNLIDYTLASITEGEIVVRGALAQQTSTYATYRFSVSSVPVTPSTSPSPALAFPPSESKVRSDSSSHEEAGIALSKQLVKRFGGQLGVEKSLNFGTTIWFTLTLEKQPPKVFSGPLPRASLAGIHVLVVSESFSLSDEDARMWGLTSHRVAHPSHVWSTLTAAAQEGQAYDIMLLHCQSLDADTLALASRIRATEGLGTLRLVFLTNWGKKGDARQVRQAGFDAYLTHPASATLLFECFAAILGQPPHPLAPNLPLVTRYTLAEARMRGRARILIVDSSLPDQKHAVRLVEELGYRAIIATTAREAIEATSRLPYAAVLLPVQMPGIDGIAAAEQIRQFNRREGIHTPLIGILLSHSDNERARCLATGMDTVVVRPLGTENLAAAIRQCSRSSAAQRGPLVESPQGNAEAGEVNLHEALARIEGDKELFDEMTALFFEEYPKSLIKMREAVTQRDAQVLAYSANALKGALGNFAATQAIGTTLRLEDMGRQGDLSLAHPTLADLEKQLTRLRAQLSDFQHHAVTEIETSDILTRYVA